MPFRPSALLLASLLSLTQCIMQEEPAPEEKLPEATQTGANTAGCRVDGLLWLPSHNGDGVGGAPLPAIVARWRKVPGGRHPLSLVLTKSIDDQTQVHRRTGLTLYLPDVLRAGTYAFDQSANPAVVNGPVAYAAFRFNNSPSQELLTGPGAPGRLVVTRLDTVARVLSGTFEFTPVEVSSGLGGDGTPIPGGRTVRVTEGRFDCTF